MMKFLIASLVALFSLSSHGVADVANGGKQKKIESPVEQKNERGTPGIDVCRKPVETLIRSSARLMGVKEKFGIQISSPETIGKDIVGNPLFKYSTGLFIIDDGTAEGEGFLPGSGASVTVRKNGKSCEVVRMDISVNE